MKKIFVIAVLALLAAQCLAMFTEKAQVQALDGELRPISNVSMYPIYQLNKRVGLVNGKPKSTNNDGYVNITFFNNEFDSSVAQGNWTLVVAYGGQSVQKAIEYVPDRKWTIQVQLPVHYAFFLIVDQQGKPMQANVSIGNFTSATDGGGYARFHLPDGTYDYSVEAMGVVKQGSLAFSNDTTERVEVKRYTLQLFVVDENAAPLVASVLVLGNEYETDGAGKLVVEGLGESSVDADIEYLGKRRVVNLNLENGLETEVVLDKSPPIIKGAAANVVDGAGRISFGIEDLGIKASGVDVNTSIRVTYVVGGTQEDAAVFPIGYGKYEAEIPIQPANTVVPYTIRVVDRDGNEAVEQGQYTVISGKTSKPTEVPGGNANPFEGVDVIQVIGAVVVLGILLGLFVYVKKKLDAAKPPPEMVP
ncbi:Uncharacterised protein [Candidatus Anstonella stagnisolia]|nr:Uncharacterised protein [Candidatus Anstonella stagnisolia]